MTFFEYFAVPTLESNCCHTFVSKINVQFSVGSDIGFLPNQTKLPWVQCQFLLFHCSSGSVSVRGSDLWVSSALPACESTRGGCSGAWMAAGCQDMAASSWLLWALSPVFSANFKQLLHLSKSSLGDWPGKEQQRIKRLHFQTTSQPPARNWTFFAV